MTPLSQKRFWFYNDSQIIPLNEFDSWFDWFRHNFMGSDEYGHHTFVIPFGKGRQLVVVYRAGYKGLFRCQDCVETRKQTIAFEQEVMYTQTYWNIENYDDVFDLDDDDWREALGV